MKLKYLKLNKSTHKKMARFTALVLVHLLQIVLIDSYFSHGGTTKGVDGNDGNPGNPCLDNFIVEFTIQGTFDENANDSC